jgi:hypothetical protein
MLHTRGGPLKLHLLHFPETQEQYKARLKDLKDTIELYGTVMGKSYKDLTPPQKNAVYIAERCTRTGEDLDTIFTILETLHEINRDTCAAEIDNRLREEYDFDDEVVIRPCPLTMSEDVGPTHASQPIDVENIFSVGIIHKDGDVDGTRFSFAIYPRIGRAIDYVAIRQRERHTEPWTTYAPRVDIFVAQERNKLIEAWDTSTERNPT